jgi:ClpP class serine protease
MISRILAEISKYQWAMPTDSFSAMLSIVKNDVVDAVSPSYFHAATEGEHKAISGLFGDVLDETIYTRRKDNIGLLTINGPIVPRMSSLVRASGLVSIDQLSSEFKALEADEEIKQIVLLIDSPGGAVTGVSDFAKLVNNSTKPTTAYIMGMAASAAYWIASATDRIVSSDTGIAGSIGVVVTLNIEDKSDKIEIVSSQSPLKNADPKTEAGKEVLQNIVDGIADVFIGAVSEYRGTDRDDILGNYGQGSIVVAKTALENGMIDAIDSFDDMAEDMKNGSVVFQAKDENKDILAGATPFRDLPKKIAREDEREEEARNIPARIAGSNNTEVSTMKLQELIANDPALAREVEEIKAEAFASGVSSIKAQIDKVVPFLSKETYGKEITSLAVKVLKGETEAAALEAGVAVYDSLKSKERDNNAKLETNAQGHTPPSDGPNHSTDGLLRTTDDFMAEIARLKATA